MHHRSNIATENNARFVPKLPSMKSYLTNENYVWFCQSTDGIFKKRMQKQKIIQGFKDVHLCFQTKKKLQNTKPSVSMFSFLPSERLQLSHFLFLQKIKQACIKNPIARK